MATSSHWSLMQAHRLMVIPDFPQSTTFFRCKRCACVDTSSTSKCCSSYYPPISSSQCSARTQFRTHRQCHRTQLICTVLFAARPPALHFSWSHLFRIAPTSVLSTHRCSSNSARFWRSNRKLAGRFRHFHSWSLFTSLDLVFDVCLFHGCVAR